MKAFASTCLSAFDREQFLGAPWTVQKEPTEETSGQILATEQIRQVHLNPSLLSAGNKMDLIEVLG